jgi:hypothetical protein
MKAAPSGQKRTSSQGAFQLTTIGAGRCSLQSLVPADSMSFELCLALFSLVSCSSSQPDRRAWFTASADVSRKASAAFSSFAAEFGLRPRAGRSISAGIA